MDDERDRSRSRYAGYVPFAGIGIGSGVGAWVASLFDSPDWAGALPGMVAGYYVSGAILRRIYSDE